MWLYHKFLKVSQANTRKTYLAGNKNKSDKIHALPYQENEPIQFTIKN